MHNIDFPEPFRDCRRPQLSGKLMNDIFWNNALPFTIPFLADVHRRIEKQSFRFGSV